MEQTLHDFGVKDITTAGNGLQAIKLFKEALQRGSPFSLVFLDIVMPEMDGQAALKQMRAIEKKEGLSGDDKATIIMATSLNSPADMINALIEGDGTDYFVKPFDVDNLRNMLNKYKLLE